MIGKCCCCNKIKWIFKNKNDGGYNHKMCGKCYDNSIRLAIESHKTHKRMFLRGDYMKIGDKVRY